MKPFNAKKALAGAKLVTRVGHEVCGFRLREQGTERWPYEAFIVGSVEPGRPGRYGADGRFWGTGNPMLNMFDLFLADDQDDAPKANPSTLTPRAQIMAMLAAGDVGRIWAASAEDMLVIMGRFRYLADEILRVDAEK